ncbi:hypothetical protein BDZ91DRAFT_732450 [Kalaharituber pfeilii]|nr:hypothetical protein BDZ91DRAFT_732450 [Kalaharituber pfeilii]
MSSSSQNTSNSAVSRGGTGAVATPANSTTTAKAGRDDYGSAMRNRPDVTRGTDKEGTPSQIDKITRTSDTGIGADSSSKATSLGERFGLSRSARGSDRGYDVFSGDPRGDDSSIVGKATQVVDMAKDKVHAGVSAAQQEVMGQGLEQRARRRGMNRREMGYDFLDNYGFEIRSEIGE